VDRGLVLGPYRPETQELSVSQASSPPASSMSATIANRQIGYLYLIEQP
jgi:hypothetical protein